MKIRFKKLVFVSVIFLLFFCFIFSAYAIMGKKNIEVLYRDIKILINSVLKTPNEEPFIFNGTTFVPLRFIAEGLNKEVVWINDSNIIKINDKESIPESSEKDWKFVKELKGELDTEIDTTSFFIASNKWKVKYYFSYTINGADNLKLLNIHVECNKIGKKKTHALNRNMPAFSSLLLKDGTTKGEFEYEEGNGNFNFEIRLTSLEENQSEGEYTFTVWEEKTSS